MDIQDQNTHTSPSGHESREVHLCHRCGWPFPNPHPSAKHRRAHKKICGTIEGYTNLFGSEVVSDDEHHPDDDKEQTPSPKIDKKTSIDSDVGDGEIRGSFSRSEDELFADAVTEFADSGISTGSANKTLNRDLFFSFKDDGNAGTQEVLNAPIVNTSIEVSEKTNQHTEKTEENEIKTVGDLSESNLELTKTLGLVKDGVVGPAPEPSHISQSQEAKSIDIMEAGQEKGRESKISETITEEATDSAITKTTPVSAIVGRCHDNVKQENSEKLESVTTDGISEEIQQDIKDSEINKTTPEVSAIVSGHLENVKLENFEKLESVTTDRISEEIKQEIKSACDHVSEAVKESETIEEIKIEKSELDREIAPGVVTGSESEHFEDVEEEIKHEKFEPDYKHVTEVTEESEIDQNVSVLNEKVDLSATNGQIADAVKEPVTVLSEKNDLQEPELEESSIEQVQEAVKESIAVLIEKEDLGGSQLEKQSIKHTHEIVEKHDLVLTEKDLVTPELERSSKEQIQEKEPNTVLTVKEDLSGTPLVTQSNEHIHESGENLDSILTEKKDLGAPESEKCTKENIVEVPHSVLSEKDDLGAHESEKCSKDEVTDQKVDKYHDLVADVSPVTITLKDSSDNPIPNSKSASGVVSEPVVKDGNGKLMNNQDSGADLTVDSSSPNSLEGTWGSVSVLSTASIDTETLQSIEKSKVHSGKSNSTTSEVFEPPSFMTLVEPESKDKEVQDSQPQPKSEASQAGWFPTLINVNNESEGRKKNEEVMAKVTNWNTGKQSTPLKNLLGEARSPSGKQPEPVVQKDEAIVNPSVNDDVSSPPKLIEDGKNGRKKRSSWVPFVCCSSVNVK